MFSECSLYLLALTQTLQFPEDTTSVFLSVGFVLTCPTYLLLDVHVTTARL